MRIGFDGNINDIRIKPTLIENLIRVTYTEVEVVLRRYGQGQATVAGSSSGGGGGAGVADDVECARILRKLSQKSGLSELEIIEQLKTLYFTAERRCLYRRSRVKKKR